MRVTPSAKQKLHDFLTLGGRDSLLSFISRKFEQAVRSRIGALDFGAMPFPPATARP
jgi:hypothetical protein